MTIAVAMAIDHGFQDVGLHRIVAGVRPENSASRLGMEKYGFRQEGLWVRQAYVDGAWRNHLCYALTAEEVPNGVMPRCRAEVLASKSGAAT
jgi:[ribosomal protein S5]-alanine N-acetyltransferase